MYCDILQFILFFCSSELQVHVHCVDCPFLLYTEFKYFGFFLLKSRAETIRPLHDTIRIAILVSQFNFFNTIQFKNETIHKVKENVFRFKKQRVKSGDTIEIYYQGYAI